MTARTSTQQLVARIRRVVEMALRVDTRDYEADDPARIRSELLPQVDAMLDAEKATLVELFDVYESAPGAESIGTLSRLKDSKFDARVEHLMNAECSPRRVADIALIARMESSRLRNRLHALPPSANAWEYVELCAKARRQVLKSATALDRALCELEDLDPDRAWYTTALERSLAVRRAYTNFRRTLDNRSMTEDADLASTLRLVGTSLAILIGRPIYESLRIADRRAIRALQRRILEWLRDAARNPENPQRQRALRLWSDITAFARLLTQVNNRPELKEHDMARLTGIAEGLESTDEDDPRRAQLTEHLHAIFGLDGELDALIEREGPPPRDELRPVVARLLEGRAPSPIDIGT